MLAAIAVPAGQALAIARRGAEIAAQIEVLTQQVNIRAKAGSPPGRPVEAASLNGSDA